MADKFKKIDKEFTLSDSSLNTYKYRLLTSGYLLSEFERNPIGYYMHGTEEHPRETGVLIKWEDLRVVGDVVLGKPCINLSHPRGQRTVDEVEAGFLNAASVGQIVALEISENPNDYLPGQEGPTVTKWFNREASLVDLPGNYNALTELVDRNLNPLNLADFTPKNLFMKQLFLTPALLALLPNLKADSTQEDVATSLSDLAAKASKADKLQTQVDTLTKEKEGLETKLEDLKTKTANEEVTVLLKTALDVDKKISKKLHDLYADQYKGRPTELKAVLDATPAVKGVVSNLKTGEGGDEKLKKFAGKNYTELDQAGLLEDLKAASPDHFFDLFKEKFGKPHNEDKREV